ncbi:MAG: hypothetical protein WDO14_25050 [Bacteroidota bacterium]
MIMMQADFAKSRDFFTRFVLVRIQLDRAKEALDFLRANWEQTVIESPFDYFFLNEKLNTVYEREDQLNRIATVFSRLRNTHRLFGTLWTQSIYVQEKEERSRDKESLGCFGTHHRAIVYYRFFEAGDLRLRHRHSRSVVFIESMVVGVFLPAYAGI